MLIYSSLLLHEHCMTTNNITIPLQICLSCQDVEQRFVSPVAVSMFLDTVAVLPLNLEIH